MHLSGGNADASCTSAGAVADTALADGTWLPLACASTEHTPARRTPASLLNAAAAHPRSANAPRWLRVCWASALDSWFDAEIRKHARAAASGGRAGRFRSWACPPGSTVHW